MIYNTEYIMALSCINSITSATAVSFSTSNRYVQPPPPIATGGIKTTLNGYIFHTFNSSGTFTVNSTNTFHLILVGGGGGGGLSVGSGGGGSSKYVQYYNHYTWNI
jgi:hypothetical protein